MNEQIATNRSSDVRPSTPDATPDAAPAAPRTRPTKPPKGARRQTGNRAAQQPDEEMTITRKRRRVARTDSGLIPALRLNRYVGRQRTERKPTVVYDTEHSPGYLRSMRLLLGLALLAVAWAASLVVVALGESLVDVFPHQPSLTVRFGLSVLGAVGIVWLAVVALALIIVGAFSLTLALTRRAW